MCYETYERLHRARAARRQAERPAAPEREAPKPKAPDAAAEPVTLKNAPEHEEEPA